jgi:hypothetical protein
MFSSNKQFAVFSALIVGLVVVGWSPNAFAWNFDDACSPEQSYEVASLPPPQALLMVDKSGSMGSSITTQTQCHYCSFTANATRNFCSYTGGEYCEMDFRLFGSDKEDWHSFNLTERCSSCTNDASCTSRADSFIGPEARDDDGGFYIGGGDEYCGYRNVDINYSQGGYFVTSESQRPAARSVADCQGSYQSDIVDFLNNNYDGYSNLSIDYRREDNCGTVTDSKWDIAKNAINTVTADMTAPSPDDVRFGLGWFYGSTADIRLDATEDARPSIMSQLNSTGPGGSTPTAEAIKQSYLSNTVTNAAGGSAGILINDGAPTVSNRSGWDARDSAIYEACQHRSVAPLYVVGFGAGADTGYNNVMAAAGGTGSCTNGDPCSNPRNWEAYNGSCSGSFQANNAAALQVALSSIANQISCTFDIASLGAEWQDPGQGCEADGYDCLKIELNGSIDERIYHVDSSNGPRGWEFASGDRQQIRVLNTPEADGDFCNQIRQGRADDPNEPDVLAKRACICTQPTGNSCTGADFCFGTGDANCSNRRDTCDCPVGTWACDQGLDTCEEDVPCGVGLIDDGVNSCEAGVGVCRDTGVEACVAQGGPLQCTATPNNGASGPEICDGLDNDCDGDVDEGLGGELCHVDFAGDHGSSAEQSAIDTETTRCKIGTLSCSNGTNVCTPLSPMPEVCNGLDDDCDAAGRIDNLSDSAEPNEQSDLGSYPAAACFQRNVCMCPPDTSDTIEGVTKSEFLDGWANTASTGEPTCTCGEGLSP